MSDNILNLIPSSPFYTPSKESIKKAMEAIKTIFSTIDHIEIEESENPKFVDSGANFEKVICPRCKTEIDNNWWTEVMSTAHNNKFLNLEVIVPCCKSKISLNNLTYAWPSGFTKFSIKLINPYRDLQDNELQKIEQILGTTLRKIWTHY